MHELHRQNGHLPHAPHDSSMEARSNKLRNLSSLDLRHITELDNETVMEIVKRCKNLTSLNLCLNWIINDR
ncbi:F-box/LRR-repeat protein 17 [Varanus komodoensis]|nr:F-box/LRR-repeat protein 17 [Varanus komodoensis]